jgi:hypothetical protein
LVAVCYEAAKNILHRTLFAVTNTRNHNGNILRLYTMELKCLHVNISYYITEVFLDLNISKCIIEERL